ncbi:aminotransferase class V-fold PLP-dependent enzyme [Microbacteriaceae bacterium VKM Ac-2855]|nr:aminotransferase class V-fold PLP-dependent enzyme [Microbacteriaceae bacterium VKM Ac-2855]
MAPVTASDTRFAELRDHFAGARGYHNACTLGLPALETIEALRADAERWFLGEADAVTYGAAVERSRHSFARIVGVDVSRVALGSQTSAMASVIACSLPDGASVVCVDGDFSSIVFPFLAQGRGITVRSVALAELASALTDADDLVVFSFIQSRSGEVADVDAVIAAAEGHGVRTVCDLTQAAGVHPVDASLFDATVTHAYKWLCSPRGVAFMTVSESFATELTPVQAGWYAGDDVWGSCYGPQMRLAADARRFDVSPAWQAFVGADVSLALHASLDQREVWRHASGLGDLLCERLGFQPQHQAIVTWADPDGSALAALAAAGLKVSGRGGRVRVAFHLWNDAADVDAIVAALRSA